MRARLGTAANLCEVVDFTQEIIQPSTLGEKGVGAAPPPERGNDSSYFV